MPTKNLVPRANGEGKLGIKGTTDLNWKEINAVSGSLELTQTNQIQNQDGNDLLAGGTGITVSHASGSNGFQYTITSSSSSSQPDLIEEGQAKVETIDTGTDARIEFWVDPNDDGTSDRVWQFNADGHLIPETNSTFDIGSAEKKVRHLYLSSTSLHIGTTNDTTDYYKLSKNNDHNLVWNKNGVESVLATESFVSSQGFATQADIDSAVQGLDVKDSVRVATTGTLTGFTYANGTTQEWQEDSATGALSIDDITLSNGDRVLVKDASAQSQNGIYVVSGIDGSSQVILDRASDLDNSSDFSGAFTFVEEGTTNTGNSYVAKNANSPNSTTVGTNSQNWTQFNSAGGGVSELNDLSDVTITSSDTGDYIRYSGSAWVDSTLNIVDDTTPQLGGTLDLNSNSVQGNLIPSTANQYDLGSVDAEWRNLYLGSSRKILFGGNQEVYFEHNSGAGLTLSMDASVTGANEPVFTIKTENNDSNTFGPTLRIQNNSTSGLYGGNIEFHGENDGGTLHYFAGIRSVLSTRTSGSERGRLDFQVVNGSGTSTALTVLALSSGATNVTLPGHNGTNSGLVLGSTLVTTTAEEINALDISAQSFAAGDDGKVLSYDHSTTSLVWAAASSGGISSVSEDSDPSLGGDLNVGTHSITTDTTNGNITITPNGTGHVNIDGIAIRNGLIHIYNDGVDVPNAEPAPSELRLYCQNNNSHYTGLKASPHAEYTGGSVMYTLPAAHGSNGSSLVTDGTGDLSWGSPTVYDTYIDVKVLRDTSHVDYPLSITAGTPLAQASYTTVNGKKVAVVVPCGYRYNNVYYTKCIGLAAEDMNGSSDANATGKALIKGYMQVPWTGTASYRQNVYWDYSSYKTQSNFDQKLTIEQTDAITDRNEIHLIGRVIDHTNANGHYLEVDFSTIPHINPTRAHTVKAVTAAGISTGNGGGTSSVIYINSQGGYNASTNILTIDGVSLEHGDLLLIKDGVDKSGGSNYSTGYNGIWYIDGEHSSSSSAILYRFREGVHLGQTIFCPSGTENGLKTFICSDETNKTYEEMGASSAGGSSSYPVFNNSGTALTATTTLTANTTDIEEIVVCNPTSAGITINLPDGSTVTDGFKYQIKNIGTQTVTITPNGSQTIDTSNASISADQYNSYTLVNYADNWLII